MRKTWEHLAAITDRLTSVLFNDDIKSFGGIGEREYATINILGGGGLPYTTDGDARRKFWI